MNYTDEESRLNFHQSKTLLQLLCQQFEKLCMEHGVIPEFIDLIDPDSALLGIPEIPEERAEAIVEEMNKQFPRKDEFLTCKFSNLQFNIFEIFVTDSRDFSGLH